MALRPGMLVLLVLVVALRVSGQDATECSEIVGATADGSGNCVCDAKDYVISSDRSECLPAVFGGHGASCNDSSQCQARMRNGAACLDGICQCVENFHYLHGRCWRNSGFGEQCSRSENCYQNFDSDSLTCSGSKCQCGDNTIAPVIGMCRRKSGAGEPCDFDLDCDGDAVCNSDFICEASSTPSTFISGETGVPESAGLSTTCPDPNTEPTEGGQCVCKMGFYDHYGNGTCLRELGESCSATDECSHIEQAVCRRSGSTGGYVCGCAGGWTLGQNNHACIKNRKFNFRCTQNEQCSYFGGECVDKTCVCPKGTHFAGNVCWPTVALGETCSVPNDCNVLTEGAVDCTGGVCQCVDNYHPTSTKDCWKNPTALNDRCEDKRECNFTSDEGSVTCRNNLCVCEEGFKRHNATSCVVGVGGPCSDNSDCSAVPTYQCVENKCACPEGTVEDVSVPACLDVAQNYGDNCSMSAQCTPQFGNNSWCDDQGTCRCLGDFYYNEEHTTCWVKRLLGQTCEFASDCYLEDRRERAACINSLCTCKTEWTEQRKSNICVSSSAAHTVSLVVTAACYLLARLS